jgi:hypothetical protein
MIGKVESTYRAEVIAKFNVLFQYLPGLRKISRNLSHNRWCSFRHFNWLPWKIVVIVVVVVVVVVCVCVWVWRPQHYTCALRHEYVRGLEVKLHAFRISALDGRCMINIGAGQHIWTLCNSINGTGRSADPKICQGLVPSRKDPVSARNRKPVFRKPLLYDRNPREESVYVPPKIQ